MGNFYASVSELGIPCIQPEIGGLGLVDDETMTLHYNGVRNVLDMLGMYEAQEVTVNENQVALDSFWETSQICMEKKFFKSSMPKQRECPKASSLLSRRNSSTGFLHTR